MKFIHQRSKRKKKNGKDSLRYSHDNIKWINIHIIRIPEGEKKEKGPGNLFEETMAENVLNLGKETDIQIQEAHRYPNKKNLKRPTQKHIEIELSNIKEGILIATREQL